MAGLQIMLSVLISPSILLAHLNLCHFTISLSLGGTAICLKHCETSKNSQDFPFQADTTPFSMAEHRENSEAAEPTEREIESEKWFALSSIHPRRTHLTHPSCI